MCSPFLLKGPNQLIRENSSDRPIRSHGLQSMQRPKGVIVTFVLMCITNATGFFAVNWQLPYARTLFITFSILITIGYFVLWFYLQGRNWARWLVMIECLQCFWNIKYLFHPNPLSPRIEPVMIASEAILAAYLIWYLNTPPVRMWFISGRAENPPSVIATA